MEQLSPPAIISAAACIGGITSVSPVLPGTRAPSPPYVGATQAEQVEQAVDELVPWLAKQGELVWGGDWNHPLRPPLTGSTVRGRDRFVRAAGGGSVLRSTRKTSSRSRLGTADVRPSTTSRPDTRSGARGSQRRALQQS